MFLPIVLTLPLLALTAGAAWAAPTFAEVKPLLESKCVSCHRPGRALGGLDLASRTAALQGGKSGPGIVPGKASQSPVYTTTTLAKSQKGVMPPGGGLSAAEVALLKEWIDGGAPWPASETIGAAPPSPTAGTGERALVQRIHDQIVANHAIREASRMENYKLPIPGSIVSFEMVAIPGGEFVQGSPPSEPGHKADEAPQHKVQLDPFWMGKYEVRWDEYRLFMLSDSAVPSDPDHPVPPERQPLVDAVTRPTKPYVEMSFGMGIQGFPAISMTQHAANKFAQWLSAKTGQFYRLPTEAEWEYACRAGTTTAYSFGDDPAKLGEYAWYFDNANDKYHKVGEKKPNPWGLYDMHGNVMEWTLDQYLPGYYETLAAPVSVNPWAKSTKPYPQTARGGSWNDDPDQLRCAARIGSSPQWKMQDPQLPKSIWYHTDAQWLGFRLVRPLKVPPAEEMYHYWNSGVEKEH